MTSIAQYGSVPPLDRKLPADVPSHSKQYPRKAVISGFIIGCAILAVLSFFAANGNNSLAATTDGGFEMNTLHQPSPSVSSDRIAVKKITADGQFTITASNALSNISQGQDYPFLTGRSLVEPFRVTTLALQREANQMASSMPISSATWRIMQTSPTDKSNTKTILNAIGANDGVFFVPITHVFKNLGTYHVETEVFFGAVDEDMALSTTITRSIMCRYVRRSLRSMPDIERGAFLDAIKTMLGTNVEDGRALYGAEYRSLEHFVGLHLNNGALRKADHLHDGLGFLTQHAAITSEFELSLQAISPALAVPYWDYTYDQYIANMSDTPLATLWAMDVWDPDWFGRAAGPLRTPTEGRFAYVTVPKNASSKIHSPYGYLRSPWNMNRSPYLTRYHDFCGADFVWNHEGITASSDNSATSWPSCEVHWQITYHVDTWYEYVWNSNYQPHGPVHFMVGGWSHCGKIAERIGALGDGVAADGSYPSPVEQLKHKLALDDLKVQLITLPKTLWKAGLVEFPTFCSLDSPEESCTMICLESMKNESYRESMTEKLGVSLFGDWEANLTSTVKAELLELMCSTPFSGGDHAEASSPLDPSFWPIHPTVDRLLQWKRIVQPFTHAEWTDPQNANLTSYCKDWKLNTGCEGHHSYDLTEWITHHENDDGEWVSSYLSNGEVFHISDPTASSYRLPYVYDNFEWPHCELAGYKFRAPV